MRLARMAAGVGVLAVALVYLAGVIEGEALAATTRAVLAEPLGLAAALVAYAGAFALRTWAWRRVLPGLTTRHAWAGLHVALLGNHVLPLRLGEALRVTSVLRRTPLTARPVIASALALRLADLAAVGALAAVSAPALLLAAVPLPFAIAGGLALGAGLVGAQAWLRRLAARGRTGRFSTPVLLATALAWLLEAGVLWQVAGSAGIPLALHEAVAVTAVTVAAQAVAVTPGGFGSYEAAATAALVALGAPAPEATAVALLTHGVKTAYALVVGSVALVTPAPSYWGRFRLPRHRPPRPARAAVDPAAPVVAIVPAHDEEGTVAAVVRGLPRVVCGHPVVPVVVDDGSVDASAARAAAAGAVVVRQPANLGLGAAVRRGLAEAVALRPAAVVYLDADGEYSPGEAAAVLAPVLDGRADYVVGSRFTGDIRRMRAHRRLGNVCLTRALRWVARRPDITDGQSGYRAFSAEAAAAAEIVHDYNYAQVLTLDLLAKGFVYAEVPISYAFREAGTSFVRLGRYLRRVLPAMHRELNRPSVLHDVATEALPGRPPGEVVAANVAG